MCLNVFLREIAAMKGDFSKYHDLKRCRHFFLKSSIFIFVIFNYHAKQWVSIWHFSQISFYCFCIPLAASSNTSSSPLFQLSPSFPNSSPFWRHLTTDRKTDKTERQTIDFTCERRQVTFLSFFLLFTVNGPGVLSCCNQGWQSRSPYIALHPGNVVITVEAQCAGLNSTVEEGKEGVVMWSVA